MSIAPCSGTLWPSRRVLISDLQSKTNRNKVELSVLVASSILLLGWYQYLVYKVVMFAYERKENVKYIVWG